MSLNEKSAAPDGATHHCVSVMLLEKVYRFRRWRLWMHIRLSGTDKAAYKSNQLGGLEWLFDVNVGAARKPSGNVFIGGASSDHDNREVAEGFITA
jgi:hypothetical protein